MQIYIAVGMAYSNVCFVGFEKEEQAARHMLSNETVKKTMKTSLCMSVLSIAQKRSLTIGGHSISPIRRTGLLTCHLFLNRKA